MVFLRNSPDMTIHPLFVIFICFTLLNSSLCAEKIVIDQSPRKYSQIVSSSSSQIEIESKIKNESKPQVQVQKQVIQAETPTSTTSTTTTSSSLEIFKFYEKSDSKICPCNAKMISISFEDSNLRIPYVEYLESQLTPIKVVENTDSYLKKIIQEQMQKLKVLLIELKKNSLNEVSKKKEDLISEMVQRSLLAIKKGIVSTVKTSESAPTNLKLISKKSELLQNLDKSTELKVVKSLKFDSLDGYVKNFTLSEEINEDLSHSIFKHYSTSLLNEHASLYFSELAKPNEGVKLIINQGLCFENEGKLASLRYARFLDQIWSEEKYTELFNLHKGKALWVYKDMLNMWRFQNLFTSLVQEDLSNSNYFKLFSRLYSLIMLFRTEVLSIAKIDNEEQLLLQLTQFIDTISKNFFINRTEKEEYLLIKTIIYNRLEQMNKKYSKDTFLNELVVDDGLPLQFYVKRKDLRKLLKRIVKSKKLNVNLNILRWEMDQLKTQEEFASKSESVLFNYLDKLFDKNISEDDKEEIIENLTDLLKKSSDDSSDIRGQAYRNLGIRYVYYKFHFNYLLKKETLKTNANGIVNIERIQILRPILEIIFENIEDHSQKRMQRIFKAVEFDDDHFQKGYLGMQNFIESQIMFIYNKLIVQTNKEKVENIKDLCRHVLFDFDMFVSDSFPKRASVKNEIVTECSKHQGFAQVSSFRIKYFYETIKLLSLASSFTDFKEKRELNRYYLEIYSHQIFFREFGPRIDNSQYHLVLEQDSFLSVEVEHPKLLKGLKSVYLKNRTSYFDLIKIANLKNLLKFPHLLKQVKFRFIYFMEIASVLNFFDFNKQSNKLFLDALYSHFKNTPKFYHFNNIYFVLKMQEQLDVTDSEQALMTRLTSLYKSINVFTEEQIKEEHYRTIVLASRIAVIYFYTIDLQLDADHLTEGKSQKRAQLWTKMEEFLKDVLIKETKRVRIYFFTDYFYENLSSENFLQDFENKEYNKDQFILEGKSQSESVGNKRELVVWAYNYLTELKYVNSPARYLENVSYSFYKELIKDKHFDKAEDMKDIMIQNALAYHRRNGHKILNDQLKTLLQHMKVNPVIPTQQHYNLVLFNCISEFIASMNSPDKRYHVFQPTEVKGKLIKFIYEFFDKNGEIHNSRLHVPSTKQYLNIKSYKLTFIISLLSVYNIEITKVFKKESIVKYLNNIEALSWFKFTNDSFKKVLVDEKEINNFMIENLDKTKKDFKPFELNNLTTQNFEGFFKRICHFEDIQANMKFISVKKSFDKIHTQVPECLDILSTLSPNESKRVIFRLVKVFHNPSLYYKDSIQIFEDDQISDTLSALKKLFVRITMTAQQNLSFFEFAQMIQKILLSNARVVNSNFQKFLKYVSEKFHITDIFKTFDSLFADNLLAVKNTQIDSNRLQSYYKNSVMHDMLTLLPLNQNTIKDSKELWQFDFYHLLNMKSNYASFLTNLFQNFSENSFEVYSKMYFLICKFKLTKMLNLKQKNKLSQLSLEGSSVSVSQMKQNQESLTQREAPEFDSFIKKELLNESLKQEIIQQLFYLKTLNIDTNLVDMSAFEISDEFSVNLVQDIRSILENLDVVKDKSILVALIKDNKTLVNNLSFYHQEAKKLHQKIQRFGEIKYMFEETDDNDIQDKHAQYINSYLDFFENTLQITVSDESSVMYRRDLQTILFKFDAKVVF